MTNVARIARCEAPRERTGRVRGDLLAVSPNCKTFRMVPLICLTVVRHALKRLWKVCALGY